MKQWVRARVSVPCGSCRASIAVGVPLLELTIGETKRARCLACAKDMFGEDPPELAAVEPLDLPVRVPVFHSMTQLARSFRDGKAQQLGERE